MSSLYILLCNNSDGTEIFKSTSRHEYEPKVWGIPNQIKQRINCLYEGGATTPKAIFCRLRQDDMESPIPQLKNYLAAYKLDKYGKGSFSYGELEQWCINNASIPSDVDQPFVLKHVVVGRSTNDSTLRVVMTTRRLMSTCVPQMFGKLIVRVQYMLRNMLVSIPWGSP